MTANKTMNYAFSAGADLWIIKAEQNEWWQEIDFRSGFLLSSSLLFEKKADQPIIKNILNQTELESYDFKINKNNLLLGSESHFPNKWILIIGDDKSDDLLETLPSIEKMVDQLKVQSIRFFGYPKESLEKSIFVTTRLTASLQQISFVE